MNRRDARCSALDIGLADARHALRRLRSIDLAVGVLGDDGLGDALADAIEHAARLVEEIRIVATADPNSTAGKVFT
jgi:hypothetical protein